MSGKTSSEDVKKRAGMLLQGFDVSHIKISGWCTQYGRFPAVLRKDKTHTTTLGIYLLLILWSTCPLWSVTDSMEGFQQSREGVKLTQLCWASTCCSSYGLLVRCDLPVYCDLQTFFHIESQYQNLILFLWARNQDVNNLWNEIESMCNNNEEQRLESERTLRTVSMLLAE